jgi:AbrB family looped-hinge helix DNA binding protein
MGTATITSKGQVTIPTDIRAAFQLNAGDKLIFVQQGEQLLVIPVKRRRLSELAGILRTTIPYPGHEEERRIAAEALAAELEQEVADL